MKVDTAKGQIERSEMRVENVVRENEDARVTATEWYLGDELVRRDVWVNALRALNIGADSVS